MLWSMAKSLCKSLLPPYQEMPMPHIAAPQSTETTGTLQRGATIKVQKKKTRKEDDWSVSHKMRLPHKVGLPLGSGGGGDDGGGW